jgi:ubiquinone/menaquinone biosynthesis C-methylase UbiE
MEKEYAEYILEKTKKDYNLIAEDYARTRHFTWDIENLVQYVSPGEKILDLGCGSGRLLEILKDKNIDYFGIDGSENLIKIAKRNYPDFKFQIADVFDLPFPNNFFDKIFSIRVLMQIPSKEFRLQFLKEAKRVLKPGGLLVLTVWYLWKFGSKKNFLLMLKNAFLKLIGKSKLDFGDALIPWDKKVMRYYHYFTKRELEKLVKESGFLIEKIWATRFDLYLIAKKSP